MLYAVAALLLLGIVVAVVTWLTTGSPGQQVPDQGNLHIPPGQQPNVPYNTSPPTSGPHYSGLAEWGEHQEPVPDPLQIHNLEDGGVIVQYNCPEGCPELVEQLRGAIGAAFGGSFEEAQRRAGLSFMDPQSAHWILAPYPGMEERIALTAWTRIDKFDEFDEQRIVRFLRAYEGIDHHR
jgi:hypothetical protein